MWPYAIMAALALVQQQAQANQAETQNKIEGAKLKYSPWTGEKSNIQAAPAWSTPFMQAAGSMMAYNQGAKQDARANKYMDLLEAQAMKGNMNPNVEGSIVGNYGMTDQPFTYQPRQVGFNVQ